MTRAHSTRTSAWIVLFTFIFTSLATPAAWVPTSWMPSRLQNLTEQLVGGVAYAQSAPKEQLAVIPLARRSGVGNVAPARIEEYLRAMIDAGGVVQLVPQSVVKAGRPRFKRSARATKRSNKATKNLTKADEAVIQARTMLEDNKNVGTAARLFAAAIKRYEKYFVELRDFTNYVDANARAAKAYLKLGRKGTAASYLTRALAVQPTLVTDRGDTEMAALLKVVRGRLEKRSKGSIQIECATPGAEVFVDGVKLGAAPAIAKDLYAGKHFVQVRHKKAEPWGKMFTVRGRRIDVTAKLELMADPAENIHISVPYSKIEPFAKGGGFHTRRVRNYTLMFSRQIQVRYLLYGIVARVPSGLELSVFLFDAKFKKFAGLKPVVFKRNLSNMQMKILEVEGNVRQAIQAFPSALEVTSQPTVYTRADAAPATAAPAIIHTTPRAGTPPATATLTPRAGAGTSGSGAGSTSEGAGKSASKPSSSVVTRSTTPMATQKPARDPYAHLLKKKDDEDKSIVKTWWFWTAVGVVAAGGVATAVLLSNRQPSPSPNFKVDALIVP